MILPRAVLVTEWAPLSHMLMNGFFFNHGFDIELLLQQPCRGLVGCLVKRDAKPTPYAAVSTAVYGSE